MLLIGYYYWFSSVSSVRTAESIYINSSVKLELFLERWFSALDTRERGCASRNVCNALKL